MTETPTPTKQYRAFLTNGEHRRYASAAKYRTIDEARAAGEKVAAKLEQGHEVWILCRGDRVE